MKEFMLHDSKLDKVTVRIPGSDYGQEISVEEFRELVRRGSNSWMKSSASLKVFVDLILHGRPLQDYHSMPVYANAKFQEQQERPDN